MNLSSLCSLQAANQIIFPIKYVIINYMQLIVLFEIILQWLHLVTRALIFEMLHQDGGK